MDRLLSLRLAAAAAASLGLIAGCGGGNDEAVAPSAVPVEAAATVEALTAYLRGLLPDALGEPLGLDGVNPPGSETAEPADLG
jgi:hypothetical protein